MNKLIKIFCLIPLIALMFTSCNDWTDIEEKQIDHVGGHNTDTNSEQYYADLRAWKETHKDNARPVYFGWFSNWLPSGPVRKGYLSSLPDSVDMISMWSAPFDLNEDRIKDKEIFQKKKGGKIFVCYILHNIGTGITPTHVSEKVKEDNPDASSDEINNLVKKAQDEYWGFTSGVKGSEDHIAAIKKYAQALLDTIRYHDYDGLDIDWEPAIGGDGGLYAGSLKPAYGEPGGKYLHILVEALSKELGPKSTPVDGKYRYLLVDGELWYVSKETAPYFDYYISQAYGDSYLDSRIDGWRGTKTIWQENYDTRKHIFTENFESYSQTGGVLLEQAAYNHKDGPKGGVGAYRLDNDYENTPDYTWTRQAIQIMHQSYKEYMEKQSNNTENTEGK